MNTVGELLWINAKLPGIRRVQNLPCVETAPRIVISGCPGPAYWTEAVRPVGGFGAEACAPEN